MCDTSDAISSFLAIYALLCKARRSSSISTRLGRNVLHIVGQRVCMDGTEIDSGPPRRRIKPSERVFHPVDVVAVREVLPRMRAAAFVAVHGTRDSHDRLLDQIFALERFDEIGVPDQRTRSE